jgi:hypothetical protein
MDPACIAATRSLARRGLAEMRRLVRLFAVADLAGSDDPDILSRQTDGLIRIRLTVTPRT